MLKGCSVLLKRLKIETVNLESGMYVVQLDCPWLQTPFFFHGFEIQNQKELKQLRHYCYHVYVDATRGSVPREQVLAARRKEQPFSQSLHGLPRKSLAPQSSRLPKRLIQALTKLDPGGTLAGLWQKKHYRNGVSTPKECARAAIAYDMAAAALGIALESCQLARSLNVEELKAAAGPLIDSLLRDQDAMVWLVGLRKRDTGSPQRGVGRAVWAIMLGRHLGFDRSFLETLALGGMLLDLGNANGPSELFNREGSLTGQERELLQRHVAVGLEWVKGTPGLNSGVVAMLQYHHERHDGSGYPAGLSGADIPVFGRIAGLVDCFDAMTTKRPYAPAKSAYDAIRELNNLSGTAFQRELVEQFVQAMGLFPTGSLVELNTGEVALVMAQNKMRRLQPTLRLLLKADKTRWIKPPCRDLSPLSRSSSPACWILRGLEPGAFGLDSRDFFG